MSDKFRAIRPNTPYEATEIELGNGRAIQMPGKGGAVEAELRRLRDGAMKRV